MANPEVSNQSPVVDQASLQAAREATESALPFVEWLMHRFSKVAQQLRSGEDVEAMERIEGLASDLRDFFQYTFLIEDLHPSSSDLISYRGRLATLLEAVNPALQNLDMVEVADIVEHDVLPALADYGPVHDQITASLAVA